jgi:hypothetical protein
MGTRLRRADWGPICAALSFVIWPADCHCHVGLDGRMLGGEAG